MKSFLKEFETFAVKGNAFDLAIGVVIGAAFSAITNSLVANIITPPFGLLLNGIDFSKLAIPLGGSASIGYGIFLQTVINFIIVAFALFLLVKVMNRLKRKQKQEEQKPAENPELKALLEIRDELRKRNG
jgi:large conductance mechanosensitive channel